MFVHRNASEIRSNDVVVIDVATIDDVNDDDFTDADLDRVRVVTTSSRNGRTILQVVSVNYLRARVYDVEIADNDIVAIDI